MRTVFKNDTMEIILNESTNEVHIRALKTSNVPSVRSSLRITVKADGFDFTGDFIQYVPTSFNGLPGFKLWKDNEL